MSQHSSLEAQVITRAAKDPAFRQNLLRDSKATIEKEFGVKLPPEVVLQVHEESATVRHVVLPRLVHSQVVRLDDSQLAAATGGMKMPNDVPRGMCTLYTSSNGQVVGGDPGDGCSTMDNAVTWNFQP